MRGKKNERTNVPASRSVPLVVVLGKERHHKWVQAVLKTESNFAGLKRTTSACDLSYVRPLIRPSPPLGLEAPRKESLSIELGYTKEEESGGLLPRCKVNLVFNKSI